MTENLKLKGCKMSDPISVSLDRKFSDVFREVAVSDLVCEHTSQKIRRLKVWEKVEKNNDHRIWWAFLTMISEIRKDLHGPNTENKMSINIHIAMSRFVGDLIEARINHLEDSISNGVTYICHQERLRSRNGREVRVKVVTHPEVQTKHKKGGGIVLRAQIFCWHEYLDRVDEATFELERLRDVLVDLSKAEGGVA
tara:strand:+ start:147 stop:734 length:588 start_codon:yes stop_codon:yes gene_type:complete